MKQVIAALTLALLASPVLACNKSSVYQQRYMDLQQEELQLRRKGKPTNAQLNAIADKADKIMADLDANILCREAQYEAEDRAAARHYPSALDQIRENNREHDQRVRDANNYQQNERLIDAVRDLRRPY